MHVSTTIFRSKKDFTFGTFTVRQGEAWLEVWGRLKKTSKTTCHLRIQYSHGKGKTYQDLSNQKTDFPDI